MLVDDEREVEPERRVRDHVAVENPLGYELEQGGEVELERAPIAVEVDRSVLRDPAGLHRRPDDRVGERLRAAAKRGSI